MEATNSLLVQNIFWRITHGLVGLDIYLSEKKDNNYLKDFLTLTEEEMTGALLATSTGTRLIPPNNLKLSEEIESLVQCVKNTQNLILNLGKTGSEKEIEQSIRDLDERLGIIYEAIPLQ